MYKYLLALCLLLNCLSTLGQETKEVSQSAILLITLPKDVDWYAEGYPFYDWLSDKEVLFEDSRRNLQILNVQTGKMRLSVNLNYIHARVYEGSHASPLALSPDRKSLMFGMFLNGAVIGDKELAVLSLPKQDIQWLPLSPMDSGSGVWALNGGSWDFLSRRYHDNKIAVVELEQKSIVKPSISPTRVSVQGWQKMQAMEPFGIDMLGYSPNHDLLCYCRANTNGEDIWVGIFKQRNGQYLFDRRIQIPVPKGFSARPSLSPSGNKIVWGISKFTLKSSFRQQKYWGLLEQEIWVSKFDGSNFHCVWKEPINSQSSIQELRWLPDESAVSFIAEASLYKVLVK